MLPGIEVWLSEEPSSDAAGRDLTLDELRTLRAVAESGSTLAAARLLGIAQTSVSRRIDAIEAALAARLFERSPGGFRPTPLGQQAFEAAQDVDHALKRFHELFPGRQRDVTGTLRVTAPEPFARRLLFPVVDRLRVAMPRVNLEFVLANDIVDLVRGDADLAFRAAPPPAHDNLVVARIPTGDRWSVYAAQEVAELHPRPWTDADLSTAPAITIEGASERAPAFQWLETHCDKRVVLPPVCNLIHVVRALLAGEGVSVLPRIIGEVEDLVAVRDLRDRFSVELYTVYHPRVRHHPAVRRLIDEVVAEISAVLRRGPDTDLPD